MAIVSDGKFALGKRLFCLYDKEIFRLSRQAVVGNTGNSKSDACKVNEKVIAAEFNLRHKVKLILQEKAVQKFAGSAFVVQHEDRMF